MEKSFVQWSPLWTYLATLHRHEPNNPRDTHRVVLNIFYVKTGELMRDFEGKGNKFAPGFSSVAGPSWPVFRLVQIPSKEELRQKNLFSVSDVKMFWQNNGEYLAVKANGLYSSPAGRLIVFDGLKGFNGQLEFYNVDEHETMAIGEHFLATDVEWDPTGRPSSLLSPEKEEEIVKNLEYRKKYEAEDQDVSLQLSEQDRLKSKLLEEEWDSLGLRCCKRRRKHSRCSGMEMPVFGSDLIDLTSFS
ncbi:hypothetical protein HPP92_005112 [Vanilla planifolia]|uniref:Translation initiation factor beta propellor-like domain-containing protein n=1 Tax=Vanilla planifolia TaxID=51239 RepID=A0A835RY45_VANPL|nr:hypothetical protein HPP92_005112 [Vanilla planifolia]